MDRHSAYFGLTRHRDGGAVDLVAKATEQSFAVPEALAFYIGYNAGKTANFCATYDDNSQSFSTRILNALKTRSFIYLYQQIIQIQRFGAGEGIRTLDPDLGKVVLYH